MNEATHLHTSDHPKVGVVMGSSSDWATKQRPNIVKPMKF